MQKREIFFFFFLWTWRETRAKRAEEGRARNGTSGTQAKGVPWAPCAPVLIEGCHLLVRPTKGVGRPVAGPTFFSLFQWCLMTATWSKNEWMGAGVGQCSLGVAPNALGHENHPSSCMHYTPNFCGCHFLPKLPLGQLSNSKIHGDLWCKRWENKICKGFHAKEAMLMLESNRNERNSNMQWLKSNMG